MAKDVSTDPATMLWSISKLAIAFGMDRRTVSKRLDGAPAAGVERGAKVFKLAVAARALFGKSEAAGDQVDPDKLEPQDRLAYYKSERERLQYETEISQLMPDPLHRAELAKFAKVMVLELETLPDKLERDCGLPPSAVSKVQTMVDDVRNAMAEAIIHADELEEENA
ncbi:DUF1441 family protein [Ferrimonas pelagia]|uniref:DUF1441 family protein n=1 Tax=Ferrimonas pelagia TaxID=1177826 RepID=A0ABP9EK65_9GAMM